MSHKAELPDEIAQLLISDIANTIPGPEDERIELARQIYNKLIETNFFSITTVQAKHSLPSSVPGLIIHDSLSNYRTGASIKAANIKLDFAALASAILEVSSFFQNIENKNAILAICAGVSLWMTFWNNVAAPVSVEEAFVMVALWNTCNSYNMVVYNEGHIATNILLKQYRKPEMPQWIYNNTIGSLIQKNCIAMHEDTIELLEKVVEKQYKTT